MKVAIICKSCGNKIVEASRLDGGGAKGLGFGVTKFVNYVRALTYCPHCGRDVRKFKVSKIKMYYDGKSIEYDWLLEGEEVEH